MISEKAAVLLAAGPTTAKAPRLHGSYQAGDPEDKWLTEPLGAAHVRPQHGRDDDAPVGLLVLLEDRHEGAAHREPRAVERMDMARLLAGGRAVMGAAAFSEIILYKRMAIPILRPCLWDRLEEWPSGRRQRS